MKKTPRFLSLIIVGCVAAASSATPASSQGNQQILQEEEELLARQELRRDELTALIAEREAASGALGEEILGLADTVAVNSTQLEVLADELEETVDQRREPENTRIRIALISFRKGDPRQSGLVDEIRALDNRGEATQRRLLYESVITEATRRLEGLDVRLQDLADQLAATRQIVEESQDQIDQLQTTRRQLTEEIAAAKTELESTLLEVRNTRVRIANERARVIQAVLTGLDVEPHAPRPAIAVKIDNVPAARPQTGINQADIVYVELVEARVTRIAAVFHSTSPGEVGPVRSMRTSDLDLLASLNSPLFSNSGGNRGTRAALSRSTLVDIGAGTAGHLYYRSSARRAPHNLYTNTANLWAEASGYSRPGLPAPLFTFRQPDEPINPTAVPARRVDINYGNTSVQYVWNGSGWNRSQDGAATVDTEGVRTSPTTVIVQSTRYGRSAADSRSPEAITVGSGPAWVFTDGHVVEATWSRQRATDVTIYTDSEGRRISILPGRTWVELPRPNSTSYS